MVQIMMTLFLVKLSPAKVTNFFSSESSWTPKTQPNDSRAQRFFFPRENQNPFRENFWQFLGFHPWIFFSFRENFLKTVRENKNVYVKISLKTHPWKQKRVCVKKSHTKILEIFTWKNSLEINQICPLLRQLHRQKSHSWKIYQVTFWVFIPYVSC